MIGIFVALLSGALMSIQGVFNTEVTRQSSVWVSASWVQFSALITCLVIWGIFDRKNLMLITRDGAMSLNKDSKELEIIP